MIIGVIVSLNFLEGERMRLSLLCDPKNEMLFEFEEIDIVEK